jgi:hypothetical protein
LAITAHYGQAPPDGQALAGGAPLAYNGKTVVYSQYISLTLWVFAKERKRRIIQL